MQHENDGLEAFLSDYFDAVKSCDFTAFLNTFHYPCEFNFEDEQRHLSSSGQVYGTFAILCAHYKEVGVQFVEKAQSYLFISGLSEAIATSRDRAYADDGAQVANWHTSYLLRKFAHKGWKIVKVDLREQHRFLIGQGQTHTLQPMVFAS